MDKSVFDQFITFDYQRLAEELLTYHSIELTSLAFIAAMILAASLTTDQQNAIGNFFQLIGQAIETVSGFNQLKMSKNGKNNSGKDDLDKLRSLLENIKKHKNNPYGT